MEKPVLSFIIPAYNEEKNLPRLLESIVKYSPSTLPYEIIIADNGSEDNTVEIARGGNAMVIVDDTATVGGLRNRAASVARGEVLVFLDADMLLTKAWGEIFPGVYQSLVENPWQVTGSRCGIPAKSSWVEKYWFQPLARKKAKYINTGHMVTTLELFEHVGGFDETLETGEDYAFSRAAASANATITNNPALAVVHEGYPKTLLQFIRREIWHGRGDCKSLQSIRSSKVMAASILLVGLHTLPAMTIAGIAEFRLAEFGIALIAGMCMVPAIYKHRATTLRSFTVVSVLYYFYYLARFLSCTALTGKGSIERRHRDNK